MRRQLSDVYYPARRRRTLLLLLLVPVALCSRVVHAEPATECRSAPRGWISVRTPEPSNDAKLRWQDVVQHVHSELLLRQVALCRGGGTGLPIANLDFGSDADDSVHIVLSTGASRQLLAERSLDLRTVPSDARLLAIAVATDELLAASFGELERRRAADARRPAPGPAPDPRAEPPTAAPETSVELGPSFVYESFVGGQTLLGAELRAGVTLLAPLTLTARVGFRQGLRERAPHGSLRGSAWAGGVGARLHLVRRGRFELHLLARGDALRLAVSAYADVGATATERHDVAVALSAGPGAAISLSPRIRLGLELAAGGVVRPVHVTDTGSRVSGASGLLLAGGGGVVVSF